MIHLSEYLEVWSCGNILSNDSTNNFPSNTFSNTIIQQPTNDFMLFPNPTTEQTQLQLSSFIKQDWQIQVFNTTGQLVYQTEKLGSANKSVITLPLNNLGNGTYYVSVIGVLDQKTMVKKLIVLE